MTEDIFDLTDLSDLPEDVKAFATIKVRKKKTYEYAEELSKLFDIAKRPLTLSEIIVGLYRQFGIKIARKTLIFKLFYMSRLKKPDIKPVNTLLYVHRSAMLSKDFEALKSRIVTRKKK